MVQTKVKLTGLTCEACSKLAKMRIGKISGVLDVKVEESGDAEITSEHIIGIEELKKALSNTNLSLN